LVAPPSLQYGATRPSSLPSCSVVPECASIMKSILAQHRFQFVSFCPVYHAVAGGGVTINDDHHLVHIVDGTGSVTIAAKTYPVAKGTVIAAPPFTGFSLSYSQHFRMRNIHYRLWSSDGEPIERRWFLRPTTLAIRTAFSKSCTNFQKTIGRT